MASWDCVQGRTRELYKSTLDTQLWITMLWVRPPSGTPRLDTLKPPEIGGISFSTWRQGSQRRSRLRDRALSPTQQAAAPLSRKAGLSFDQMRLAAVALRGASK